MISSSILVRTRMLSQLSNQWLPPTVSGLISYLEQNPSQKLQVEPVLSRKIKFSCYPSLNFGRRRCFSHISNVYDTKQLLNVGVNQPYFCARAAGTDDAEVSVIDLSPLQNGSSTLRVSRVGRADAQNALFDYLHCTRNLHFMDAEHMSKNSPVFLQKLLSKLNGGDQDVGRSLTRFLRFHPINEFEPFFESLGLKPNELYPLLPRSLIFLSDDVVLLDNYHVLCHYGVPRSKIGKMYKEGTKIFRYGDGVLSSKFRAYEELGLSRPTIIKLVTCCPELLLGDVNADFLQVLEKLRSLGVELDLIRGCFSDKSRYNWKRIFEMLDFLDRMCSNKRDLVSLISKHPRFLFEDSGRKIYILVAMLLKLGLSMDKILSLFLHCPRILAGNFTKYLWKSVHFLAEIGMETDDIALIISTHPQVLGSSSCKRPDIVLRNLNVSAERLCEIIIADPSQFNNLASRKKISIVTLPKVDTHYLQEKTTFLLRIGFIENSDEMAKALTKFRGRGDQLQERCDILVNAGLDCHTVSEMVKLVPQMLNQSTDVIKKKLNYLLNHLGYPLESLVAFPAFLCYNMEKIKLRFSMVNWLKEHGIVRPTKNRKMAMSTAALSTILACSDARFIKYYVNLHPEGPNVWEKLKNSSSSN